MESILGVSICRKMFLRETQIVALTVLQRVWTLSHLILSQMLVHLLQLIWKPPSFFIPYNDNNKNAWLALEYNQDFDFAVRKSKCNPQLQSNSVSKKGKGNNITKLLKHDYFFKLSMAYFISTLWTGNQGPTCYNLNLTPSPPNHNYTPLLQPIWLNCTQKAQLYVFPYASLCSHLLPCLKFYTVPFSMNISATTGIFSLQWSLILNSYNSCFLHYSPNT